MDAVPEALLDQKTTTSPHDLTSLPGYELGDKAGYLRGRKDERKDLLEELKLFLAMRGLSPGEIKSIVKSFEVQLTPL